MGQLINLLIVLGSLGGIVFILYRKIPVLIELPSEGLKMGGVMRQGVRKVVSSQKVRREKMLDSTLSKARSLASKTETHTSEWLERLREKSKGHKEEFTESYWERLRKKKKQPPA